MGELKVLWGDTLLGSDRERILETENLKIMFANSRDIWQKILIEEILRLRGESVHDKEVA